MEASTTLSKTRAECKKQKLLYDTRVSRGISALKREVGGEANKNWCPHCLRLVVGDANSWCLGFTFPSFSITHCVSLVTLAELAFGTVDTASWTSRNNKKKKRGGYFTHFTVLHDLKSFRNAEGRVWLLGQDNKYVQRRKKKKKHTKKLSLCVCHHRATFQEYFSLWRHDWLPEVSGSGTTPCHFFLCHETEP